MSDIVRAYAPGRTELAGNHTDHQGGRVIAAAVSCGVEIELEPNDTGRAHVESEGFDPVELDVRDREPRESERNSTAALVRGVIAGMNALGVRTDGFYARVTSTVPPGGGLSSSAAFELALACALAGGEAGSSVEQQVLLAKVGQAAERDYFGKPCGLMDQLAVALGGVACIDFSDSGNPTVERIDFDFNACGYALCLVDAHCDHSLYTEAYAQVPKDMYAVAGLFGKDALSKVDEAEFFGRFKEVRDSLGDVPALRALHFYHENRLVDTRARALYAGDIDAFLDCTRQSGASSAQYLQNISTYDRRSQPAMVALALVDHLLDGNGACRIHGGGFGGTIQAFVPLDRFGSFASAVDRHLGAGSCHTYRIDPEGARLE